MSQIAELLNASVSVHWLRHAHASHAIDNGAPITLVSATLGHADLKTTSGLCPRSARREFGALPKDQVIGFALHRSGARHSTDLRASRRHLGSDFRWSFLYAPLRLNCRDRERQTPEGTELGNIWSLLAFGPYA